MCVHTALFDQLMESPRTHIFYPQMAVSQVFHLLLSHSFMLPLDFTESFSVLLQRALSVYYPYCVQKKKQKKLLNIALQISPEYISVCRRMIVYKSRPAKFIYQEMFAVREMSQALYLSIGLSAFLPLIKRHLTGDTSFQLVTTPIFQTVRASFYFYK